MAEIAVLAKAPAPGFAKTRLIPVLGLEGAAALQRRLMERALRTALAAGIGPVTLWCAPDPEHDAFEEAERRFGVRLAAQPSGDLGDRMLAAFEASKGSVVVVGTDCPCLAPEDLRAASSSLAHADAVIAPAEDGGYGLIAASRPLPILFRAMPWSSAWIASLTRERAKAAGLRLHELRTVWDVDTPEDYRRFVRSRHLRLVERDLEGAGG